MMTGERMAEANINIVYMCKMDLKGPLSDWLKKLSAVLEIKNSGSDALFLIPRIFLNFFGEYLG